MQMKILHLFLLLLFCAAAGRAPAQTDPLRLQPLKFSTVSGGIYFFPQAAFHFSLRQNNAHVPGTFDPVVHYPAFFCRMELKSVTHLGVRIKVHAGDYDNYSRPLH